MFAPDSVTWRVHADPAMLIGGMRALLVQALHPLAMAGVEQHQFAAVDRGQLFIQHVARQAGLLRGPEGG